MISMGWISARINSEIKLMGDPPILSQLSQTIKSDIRVPLGHVLISGRWRNTDLASSLQSLTNVLYEDCLGVVDFHPSSHVGVIYVSEADLVVNSGYRRKLAKLRKANKVKGYVIVERTDATSQYFPALQTFCVLEIGFVLIPVSSQAEAASFLAQMVHMEEKLDCNPFIRKRMTVSLDNATLKTLQCIPKLGNTKAKQLLEKFQSIYNINQATVEELTSVVGRSSAKAIKDFFGDS